MNLKNVRECDKSKNTCKQKLPIVYMSFNNFGHLINTRDKNKIIKTVCDGQSAFFHCYSVSQHCVIITEVTGTLSTGKVKVNLLVSTP